MGDREHRQDPVWMTQAQSDAPLHPEAAEVSLCREGELNPRDAAAVRAHLDACPRCRRLDAKLAEMHRMLRHHASENMTATIAARIDRALAREAADGSTRWPPAPRTPSAYS